MECREFEEYMPLDLYGDLPPEQRALYEAHLANCAQCRAAREQVRGLHEVLAQRTSGTVSRSSGGMPPGPV